MTQFSTIKAGEEKKFDPTIRHSNIYGRIVNSKSVSALYLDRDINAKSRAQAYRQPSSRQVEQPLMPRICDKALFVSLWIMRVYIVLFFRQKQCRKDIWE